MLLYEKSHTSFGLWGVECSQSVATLVGANLQDAVLPGADLKDADLIQAQLQGADLTEVRSLSQAQLEAECVDSKTTFPEGFRRPPPCRSIGGPVY